VERLDIFRVALVTSHQRPARPAVPEASPVTAPNDPLSVELRRCSALGPQDDSDPRCQAVWEDNRRRFFGQSGGAS
jgi:conjugative transfer region protein TrbK